MKYVAALLILALLAFVLLLLLSACKDYKEYPLQKCTVDEQCVLFWTDYNSHPCPSCSKQDERWQCYNRANVNQVIASWDAGEGPVNSGCSPCESNGIPDCKCVNGNCAKEKKNN
ncbi:hypothetical protein JW868_01165 [Candidatus Woesearchaeota archaeon]|nr:hypothetical protein [Candidatus Woesearchaeota archaeon]